MSDLDLEGGLVREILYGTRHNVNFIHEVFRQAFLLSFSHSPAMKRVITVYKDWIQMNVQVRTCLISRLIILLLMRIIYSTRHNWSFSNSKSECNLARQRKAESCWRYL